MQPSPSDSDDGDENCKVYENKFNRTTDIAPTPALSPGNKQDGYRVSNSLITPGHSPHLHSPSPHSSTGGRQHEQLRLIQWCGYPSNCPVADWTISDTKMADLMSDTLSSTICRVLGIWGQETRDQPDTNTGQEKQLRLEFSLLGEGSWNRTYTITCRGAETNDAKGHKDGNGVDWKLSQYVLRVSLPIWPGRKVTSEVANMRWVQQNTSIPLPSVLCFKDFHPTDGNAKKGSSGTTARFPYPWILMEKVPGVPFAKVYREMSQDSKLSLARNLADWSHELATRPFPLIGSLDLASDRDKRQPHSVLPSRPLSPPDSESPASSCTSCLPDDVSTTPDPGTTNLHQNETVDDFGVKHNKQTPLPFTIGPAVSQKFYGDWRLEYHLHRGPFSDLHSFAKSLIACQLTEVQDPRQRLRTEISIAVKDDVPEPPPTNRDAAFAAAAAGCSPPWNQDVSDNQSFSIRAADYCSATDHKPDAPVCLCFSRYYDLEQMDSYKSLCESVGQLVDAIAPWLPVWPPTSPHPKTADMAGEGKIRVDGAVLHHWDLSGDNLLVDPETGKPTGVIDWEQLFLIPIPLAHYYPDVIAPGFYAPEHLNIEEWEAGQEKPEWRLIDEDRWNRRLMREAFDGRLLQLNSPWLDARVQKDFYGYRMGGRWREQKPQRDGSTSADGVDTWEALATDVVSLAMKTWYHPAKVQRLWKREEALRSGSDLVLNVEAFKVVAIDSTAQVEIVVFIVPFLHNSVFGLYIDRDWAIELEP